MTVFILKIIAMITMLIDHLAYNFFNDPMILRCIGRIAFPIYAFLLVEGFRHMENDDKKILKHLGALIFLSLISELPYDIMECSEYSFSAFISTQNAILTMLFGFVGLIGIKKFKGNPLMIGCVVAVTAFLSFVAQVNYKGVGVLLMYAFYIYLNRMENMSFVKRLLCLFLIFLIYIPIYNWTSGNLCNFEAYIKRFDAKKWWYVAHIAVVLLLSFYKGKKGINPKWFSITYRYFYPVHLFIIAAIKIILSLAGIL